MHSHLQWKPRSLVDCAGQQNEVIATFHLHCSWTNLSDSVPCVFPHAGNGSLSVFCQFFWQITFPCWRTTSLNISANNNIAYTCQTQHWNETTIPSEQKTSAEIDFLKTVSTEFRKCYWKRSLTTICHHAEARLAYPVNPEISWEKNICCPGRVFSTKSDEQLGDPWFKIAPGGQNTYHTIAPEIHLRVNLSRSVWKNDFVQGINWHLNDPKYEITCTQLWLSEGKKVFSPGNKTWTVPSTSYWQWSERGPCSHCWIQFFLLS